MQLFKCDFCGVELGDGGLMLKYRPSIWERLGLASSIIFRTFAFFYPKRLSRVMVSKKLHLCFRCKGLLYDYLSAPRNTIEEIRNFHPRVQGVQTGRIRRMPEPTPIPQEWNEPVEEERELRTATEVAHLGTMAGGAGQ